jgi:ferric-dicitrate binding protein FerR (iron transport regulator)
MPDGNLDSLLARLVDETITPTEFQELEQQLGNNLDAQRRYLHYLDLHADLQEVDEVTTDKSMGRRRWTAGFLALAAVVLLTLFFPWHGTAPKPLVQVVDADGPVRWLGTSGLADADLQPGKRLPGGTLETLTPDSSIELAFDDGTTLVLSGQSVLMISLVENQKVLRLRQGNLSVQAEKQEPGQPLQVFTPSSEAEVLGTQFNVKADAFSTRFTVNKGRVRVKRIADGRVEEVGADQQVVAALELGTEFTATSRRNTVTHWQSVLPRDQLQGLWEPGVGLRAMPHLWKGTAAEPTQPVLLYSTVFDPSAGKRPPVQLTEDARLTVQGRIDRPHPVSVGFGTNRARGGPIGKYAARSVEVTPDEDGRFFLELALDNFSPTRTRFPSSPLGQEIDWLWIQTVKVDAGLVVERVELGR